MEKLIYIAGKITGEDLKERKKKFDLYGYSTGCRFIHGFVINQKILGKASWETYMKNDIAVMIRCDEVHFLEDWCDSKGAKIEHQLCLDLGIKIIYE